MDKEPTTRLNFYDLIALFVRWRKLFIVNFIVVVVAAVVIALVLPVYYTATTVLLPPGGGSTGIPSFLSKDLVGLASSFGLEMPTEEIYQTILTSRRLAERMIERFDLRKRWKISDDVFFEDVLEAFKKHMTVDTRKDQSIVVTFEDRSPELAASLANVAVEELDRIYRDITSETARQNRIYIGRRLANIEDSLHVLEDSMMTFQQVTGAISIPEQVQTMLTAAAQLKAQQLAREVELDVLKSSFGADHPYVLQLERTTKELKANFNTLVSGRQGKLFLSLQELPELGKEYADLYRKIQIQSRLLEYVYPQYESALIQEQRESANVQILDRARVPEKKTRPYRKMIVLVAGLASILATFIIVLVLEYWRDLPAKNSEDWNKVQGIWRMLRRK